VPVTSGWLHGSVPDDVARLVRPVVDVVASLPSPPRMGIVSGDGVLLAGDERFLALLGDDGEENVVLGRSVTEFIPSWAEQVMADGTAQTRSLEDRVLTPAGREHAVSIVASPLFAPVAKEARVDATSPADVVAWAVTLVDGTLRAASDATESERDAILTLPLDSPREFVIELDADGRVVHLSPSLERVLRIPDGASVGDALAAMHPALVANRFTAALAAVLGELRQPPHRAEREMAMPTPSGERIVQWSFEGQAGADGSLLGVVGIGRDVTPHRIAERERERNELRLRTLVGATNQVVWVTGSGGRFYSPADTWVRFTGQPAGEMLGAGWADAIHPDDRERVVREWHAAVAERRLYESVHRLRRADGTYRWMEVRAVPLPEDEANEPGYIGAMHDVDERERAEAAVRRRLDMESMVGAVSSRLAGVTIESIPAAIDYVLCELSRSVGAERVSLYELGVDGQRIERVRTWRRGMPQVEDGRVVFDMSRLLEAREQLAAREIVRLDAETVATARRQAGAAAPGGTRAASAEIGASRAALLAPLLHDTRLIGFVALEADGDEAWDDDDRHLIRVLADQLAGLLVRCADEQNLRSVSDSLLAFGPDVDENLNHLCRAAAEVTSADFVVYDGRQGNVLVAIAGWGLPPDLPRSRLPSGSLSADLMARPDDRVRVIRDLTETVYAHTCPFVRQYDLRSFAGVAVMIGREAVAAFGCYFIADVALRESQLELVRMLGRAAAIEEGRRRAIESRVLSLSETERALERTAAALSAAMSSRDPFSEGHERRVVQLATAIGEALLLSGEELRLLRLAATLHDVGKIAVPAETLSKPARLTPEELAAVKRHCEVGRDLLEPASLPEAIVVAVLQHHERLDGSGYPCRLAGDEIDLYARIIAVADVVEAMASVRPYRPSLGVDAALDELELGRGRTYDDAVVDVCLRLFRQEGFVLDE